MGSTARENSAASFYDGRSVCVTGGAGFIGSHLVRSLVESGAHVAVIDDLSNGLHTNIAPVHDRITFHEASILDEDAIDQACRDAEVVFHLAALGSVPRSVEDPLGYMQVNAIGTQHVLEAARRCGCRRIVYASSSSAYGDQPQSPKTEAMTPDTRSPYAASKLTGELLLRSYAICYGLSSISLRYFNIFGPRQRPDSQYAAVIPRWADALLSGERPIIFGDGGQTRDFTHVANAVHANLLAGAAQTDLAGEAVNIACGQSVSLLELLDRIAAAYDMQPNPEFEDTRAGDVRHSLADISRARELIGYEPVLSLDEGLRDALDAYRTALGAT